MANTSEELPTDEQIQTALANVIDPELRKDIVELGMVRSAIVHPNGVVDVVVSLTTAGCPLRNQIRAEAETAVKSEPALGGFIFATVLSHDRLEDAVCHRLAQRLNHSDVDAGLIGMIFNDVLEQTADIGRMFRADLAAVGVAALHDNPHDLVRAVAAGLRGGVPGGVGDTEAARRDG